MGKTVFTNFALICSFVLVLSCKKSTTASGSSGGGSAPQSSTGSPSGTYNGVFTCSNDWIFPSGATANTAAYLYATPVSISGVTSIPAGTATVTSVSLGTVTCNYYAPQHVYSAGSIWDSPAVWTVNGAGIIPSFSYTDSSAVPNYGNAYSLPQTIIRNQNLLVPITNLSGADQIIFVISDGSGKSTSVSKGVPVSSITFLKDSLSKLSAGGGHLEVYATKYNSKTIGSQNFLFGIYERILISSITLQ